MNEPQPTEAFRWTQEPWGSALRCAVLAEVADHFYTTRQLQLCGAPEEIAAGWQAIAESIGVDTRGLVRLKQIHGTASFVLRRGDPMPLLEGLLPEADIAVTDNPAVALAVQVADCVPLLLADPRTGTVAAAHAGWRGTASEAAVAAVDALVSTFAARPADILAAIGPSIGPCCYQVGSDVVDRFRARHSPDRIERWFSPSDDRAAGRRTGQSPPMTGAYHLDLWQATRDQLEAAGLVPDRIHVAELCTATNRNFYHSYRAEGRGTGRMVGVIRMRSSALGAGG